MVIDNFIRFAEVIKPKEDKRVVSVTISPLIADCTGEIYFVVSGRCKHPIPLMFPLC